MNRYQRRKSARTTRKPRPQALPVRQDRVEAFCDWIETIPADPPFWTHPGFGEFADLTDGELMAAQLETDERILDHQHNAMFLRRLAGKP